MRNALRSVLAAVLLGAALGLSSGAAANAATTPEVTADPVSIAAGETSIVTATGLGGLETASFGMGESDGATFTESGTASYDAPASNGSATATFTGRSSRFVHGGRRRRRERTGHRHHHGHRRRSVGRRPN